ncbi:hypothetical protein ACGFIW_24470 [Micromonospora sp. NPDC048935]|uniref:hypothetical protein n=1 Tax=Micromonospora sp. NPDC048935 TaxID=3364262 RepID=UPI0037106CAC
MIRPDQPIFYPLLDRWYAATIAREWNVPAGGVGHLIEAGTFAFDYEDQRTQPYPVGGRVTRGSAASPVTPLPRTLDGATPAAEMLPLPMRLG